MSARCRIYRNSSLLMLSMLFAVVPAAAAQKRVAGVSKCGEPVEQHAIGVGDAQDHAVGVSKVNCTWSKPFVIEGVQSTEDEITGASEAKGNTVEERLYVTTNMSNGDKAFARATGATNLRDGAPQSAAGTWTYVGGTGKLAGIKGKGTYKCSWGADRMATCEVQGQYTIPGKSAVQTKKADTKKSATAKKRG